LLISLLYLKFVIFCISKVTCLKYLDLVWSNIWDLLHHYKFVWLKACNIGKYSRKSFSFFANAQKSKN
jgi:hypothetical protein